MSTQDTADPADSNATAPSTMTERTVKGSCHCKAITYEFTIPFPEPPIATRCNCTICLKSGFTGINIASPSTNFKLLTPSTLDALPDYQFNSPNIHHNFCTKCSVTVLKRGFFEFGGQKMDFFGVNAATVDQPQEGIDLSKFKIGYYDGRNDAWQKGKKETPYENGLI